MRRLRDRPRPRATGADGLARHAPLSIAELDGHALGARAAAKARAWTRARRAAAGPLRGGPGADARSPTSSATWRATGSTARRSTSAPRSSTLGEEQFDPALSLVDDPLALGLGYDAEGTPAAAARRWSSRAHRRRDPRPAVGCRGGSGEHRATARRRSRSARWRATSALLPTAPDEAASEVDGPVVRLLGGRAGRRCRARDPGLRLLVHPRPRPAHARPDRPDPQRRLADRGRRGHPAAAELPVHAVLRAGAGSGERARRGAYGDRRARRHLHRPPRPAGPARPCTSRPGTSPAARRAEASVVEATQASVSKPPTWSRRLRATSATTESGSSSPGMSASSWATASGSPSLWPCCSTGICAVRDVDRLEAGVVRAPDVVEEPVADVDAAGRVLDADRLHGGPERLGRGLGPRDLAGVDGAVDQVEHPVAARRSPRATARGQIVLDRTPTLMPRSRSVGNSGATCGSVAVCGSQNSR